MKILATIPARAGSKGIPGKNRRRINELPLWQHAVMTAQTTQEEVTVVVVTDDRIIERECKDKQIPYVHKSMPDNHLAWDAWQFGAKSMFAGNFDMHIYLEPTSPCRTIEDVTSTIKTLDANLMFGVTSVCTVSPSIHPAKLFRVEGHHAVRVDGHLKGIMWNNAPRQSLKNNFFKKNGICYACTQWRMSHADTILDENTFFKIIDRPVVNIDTEEDLLFAEALINAKKKPNKTKFRKPVR
jgi:CMP-N,N'-diacetyllegionaminic acid synthase